LFVDHITLEDFFGLEQNLLKLLAQKYKNHQEERDQERAIPNCQNCNFRRQQPITFPAGCEGWCQECIEQKKRNDENPLPEEENPIPLPTPPSDGLTQTKSQIQAQYNLNSEEFNLVLEPLTDLKVLEEVAKLISKIKERTKDTDLDSLLESLLAYQKAPDNSLKRQAYQAANSYQQQVEQLVNDLVSQTQKRKSSLQELVSALDEAELNRIYQLIKEDSELYQGPNETLIDNHKNRVVGALQISSSDQVSDLTQELVTTLRTIITSDSNKEDLINLEQKVKEYQTAPEGEKNSLYQQHSSIIDQILSEIQTELTRRSKSEDDQQDNPTPSPTQPAKDQGLTP
jgi:hypothetical protein